MISIRNVKNILGGKANHNPQYSTYSQTSSVFYIQPNLFHVTFQGNIETGLHDRWSLNTGLINMNCTVKGN
jgi:hypothetical protein